MQRDEENHAPAQIEAAEIEITEQPEPKLSLEDLVADAHAPAPQKKAPLAPGLRTARVVAVDGRVARVLFRGAREETIAAIAPETEREIIEDAALQKDSVLVEIGDDGQPFVVGVVQTRKPSEVHVTGEKIVVEGSREVLLRAGRAALRLREDGDVELVGSRISAASRGLFRIVGRILRLN
ncbi:MAG: hypothetical protein U0441_00430 [Polyangiaceae bacterium]